MYEFLDCVSIVCFIAAIMMIILLILGWILEGIDTVTKGKFSDFFMNLFK